jgi:hypothetical protein
MGRLSHSKIAFNPWLREAAQARARLIQQAKAEGDFAFLKYMRRKETEAQRELLLAMMPPTPETRTKRWIVPDRAFRRGRPYTKRNLSSGEDSDAAC